MKHYRPDDEARALADENARRRSVEPTGRGHNDYLRMREAERAALDPLGLDDETVPNEEVMASWLARSWGWRPEAPERPVSVRMGKDRIVTVDEEPAAEEAPFSFAFTFHPVSGTVQLDSSWDDVWSALSGGVVTFHYSDPILVNVVSIDSWSSNNGNLALVHGDRGSTADLEQVPAIDPTLNRKRHGAASVCPRHGPTRGGLCRKCQR